MCGSSEFRLRRRKGRNFELPTRKASREVRLQKNFGIAHSRGIVWVSGFRLKNVATSLSCNAALENDQMIGCENK